MYTGRLATTGMCGFFCSRSPHLKPLRFPLTALNAQQSTSRLPRGISSTSNRCLNNEEVCWSPQLLRTCYVFRVLVQSSMQYYSFKSGVHNWMRMEKKRSSCLVNFHGRKPVLFNWGNQAIGNFERFIHADFVTGSSWSH